MSKNSEQVVKVQLTTSPLALTLSIGDCRHNSFQEKQFAL